MRVLAIDPGERVGYATATIFDPADGQATVTVTSHGISPLKDFAVHLDDVFDEYDLVIYETYRISANPRKLKAHIGSDVPTLQLIGMIRLYGWLNPKVKVVPQPPSGKATADKTLAAHPLGADIKRRIDAAPATHDDAHDTDALRHLWLWFWRNYA